MNQPKQLKPGSKIAIISPAGSVQPNANFLDHVMGYIKKHGYEPVLGEHSLDLYDSHYRYGGTTENRVKDLNWALNDNNIDAVWATRGGYGSGQLLDCIDLTEFSRNPKWYIGFSDNTFIHGFLTQKGFQSLHAHNVIRTGGAQEQNYDSVFALLKGEKPNYTIQGHKEFNREGVAKGKLIGGNLTCICALVGSKYNFNYQDAILFLEEINENAHYKIDRYLTSLEQAGLLAKLKGVIVGSMRTNINEVRHDFDINQMDIISRKLEKYKIPVAYAFPAGHIANNWPLIMGAELTLDVKQDGVNISY